jgi:Fe-S-cluster-containing dehydrogenase component/CRP-like cAMP-binding protein
MAAPPVEIDRPQRWDTPFGDLALSQREVEWVRGIPLFAGIDPENFKTSAPFDEILGNDTRIIRHIPGDVIYRQGDYGTSAFVVLSGRARVVLEASDEETAEMIGGTEVHHRLGLMGALAQLWQNARTPEARDYGQGSTQDQRVLTEGLFIDDVPVVLDKHATALIEEGQLFGELSALGRTPRTSTVYADTQIELLEIRWQGLRDICRAAPELQRNIDELYRRDALGEQLSGTPFLEHLSAANRQRVAEETGLESYGNREWTATYRRLAVKGGSDVLRGEPIIAEEGHYPNGLILIRSGFARVSQSFGNGHRTLSYLGKGQIFGLEEIVEGWRTQDSVPYRCSLRAVGYVDVVVIPSRVMEDVVLPGMDESLLPSSLREDAEESAGGEGSADLPTEILEQLVERRYINGTATMMIDMDRCTRCDDCVRACASTHDGNPRFLRHGAQVGRYMIANACMHCQDPVCMIGCPTGAIHRAALEGQLANNDRTCIGCATCANNCPYDNIRMVEVRDTGGTVMLDRTTRAAIVKATKCDLCVDQMGGPACQRACPHDALKRVDMRETNVLLELLNRS